VSTALQPLTDVQILALTLYGEARSEGLDGMWAVASVIATRAKKRGVSWRTVCLQPLQFSCWNDNDPNREKLLALASAWDHGLAVSPSLRRAMVIAQAMHEDRLGSNVGNADHYYSRRIPKPSWAGKMRHIATIKDHIFLESVA
jgi:N-acetylmuramoyl-L-alanine amidase